MKTLYFPIASTSLAHYFQCACIRPAIYFDNKAQDIQNKYPTTLLLTDKKGTKDTDCCLELIFEDDENNLKQEIATGWFIFNEKPLPITRVKKIMFCDEEQRDRTISNITLNTAFIPQDLIKVCEFEDNSTTSLPTTLDIEHFDQSEKIKQFDSFLGALAIMRLAHEPGITFSHNYIATLAFFNESIKQSIDGVKNIDFDKDYKGIFTGKGFKNILPYLNKTIDKESLDNFAKNNNATIVKNEVTRLIELDKLEGSALYTLAILYTYGLGDESRPRRVDDLIINNFNNLREDKKEGVALCYGYNRGYNAFTKSYSGVDVKYKLESQLDYYTIESVYQYVFNNRISSDFPYLESWCPKLSTNSKVKKNEYKVLDQIVIFEKLAQPLTEKWWDNILKKCKQHFADLGDHIMELIKPIIENICNEYDETIEEIKQQKKRIEEENKQSKNKLDEANSKISVMTIKINELTNKTSKKVSDDPILENTTDEAYDENQINNNDKSNIDANTDCEKSLSKALAKNKDKTLKDLKKETHTTDQITLEELLHKLTSNHEQKGLFS